jgi:hypothetical protein
MALFQDLINAPHAQQTPVSIRSSKGEKSCRRADLHSEDTVKSAPSSYAAYLEVLLPYLCPRESGSGYCRCILPVCQGCLILYQKNGRKSFGGFQSSAARLNEMCVLGEGPLLA